MRTFILLALATPVGCALPAAEHSLRREAEAPLAEPVAARSGAPAPNRLREFFPEVLFWNPEVVTDDEGTATLHFPAADSITTWGIAATANTRDGRLGFGGSSFRVFKEFFVEPDLPPVLTEGDRISLPVAVYNFLDREQRVWISLVPDEWYELSDERARTVRVPAKGAASVAFDLVARRSGTHALHVEARGEEKTAVDAIRRAVTVWPDGRERTHVINARVSGRTTLSIEVPSEALPGSARLVCKCYPGVFGTMLEGLEGMLRKPHG